VDTVVHDLDWVVEMIDAVAVKPNRPLRYKQPKAIEGADYLNTSVTVGEADFREEVQ
jgi:hypothetical protein